MAVDVYLKQDILNILRATYAAGDGPASMLAELLEGLDDHQVQLLLKVYRQGFNAALGAVGLAFGIDGSPQLSMPTRTGYPITTVRILPKP